MEKSSVIFKLGSLSGSRALLKQKNPKVLLWEILGLDERQDARKNIK